MHPFTPPKPKLVISNGHGGLTASIIHEGETFSISLPTGRVERTLDNIFLHLHSGLAPLKIVSHFHNHEQADPQCPCCKLEGRILASSGRKRPSDADRAIAARSAHGGTVQVRHIPASRPSADMSGKTRVFKPGLSGAQLRAYEEAYFKREAKPKAPTHPSPVKFVKTPIEELI